jgi:HK97 gp10 family phage protein
MAKKNPVLHVEGADALNKALRSVGDRAGGLVLRKAAEAGAKVIEDEAKRLAPRDTGALAAGITAEARRIQQGRAVFDIGIGKREWYGRLVELGTEKMPAHPFLRPALDAKAEEAQQAVSEALRDALAEVLS